MKFDFMKKLNGKIVAISAAAVLVIGGGAAAIALAAAPAQGDPEISEREQKRLFFPMPGSANRT